MAKQYSRIKDIVIYSDAVNRNNRKFITRDYYPRKFVSTRYKTI